VASLIFEFREVRSGFFVVLVPFRRGCIAGVSDMLIFLILKAKLEMGQDF
jgi:hypothetical protein